MNKGSKFAIIFVVLLLIGKSISSGLKDKRKMIFEIILKKYGPKRTAKFEMVYNALKQLKLSDLQFNFTLAQMMQETGVFVKENGVFEKNTNASGISWSGSPGQLATGATRGTARPVSEGKNTYYAKYPNLSAWAKDYMRILNKGSMPLNATTPEDFVHRLKQNKYFTEKEEIYRKNVQSYYKLITNV